MDEYKHLSKKEREFFAYDDGKSLNETLHGFASVAVELVVDVRLVGWAGDG